MTALLPIQDVSGATETHVGAALLHFGSCYASFGLVMDTSRCPLQSQNVQKYGSKVCVWASSNFFEKKMYLAKDRQWEKKEGRSSFVLPEITNMCTYITRASGFFFIKKINVKILAKLVEFTLQKQKNSKIFSISLSKDSEI
jgi:hypothetical protein